MKRALSVFCTAVLLFLFLLCETGNCSRGFPDQAAEALLKAQGQSGTVMIRGTVSKCEKLSTGIRLSVNHLSIQNKKNSVISLLSDLNLIFTTEYTEIQLGDIVCVKGEFRSYDDAANPGEFDAKAYYWAQNTVGQLRRAKILFVEKKSSGPVLWAHQMRAALRESYCQILPDRAARTISAISLGEKNWMEREWKQQYQEGGISHILAISGLHISLLGMLGFRLLRRFRCSFQSSALFSAAVLSFYLFMSGFSISARRACIMFFVWLGAQVCGRSYDMLTAISVAALLLVAGDGRNLYQASFLLSFSAVLTLSVVTGAVLKSSHITGMAGKAVGTSLTVWFGTLPFTAYFFYQASPWSVVANLVVVPLMGILMTSGLIAACVGMVSVSAGMFFAAPVRYLLSGFEWLCRFQQRLPVPVWVTGRPEKWRIVVYYMVLLGVVWLTGQIFQVHTRKTARGGRKKNCLGKWGMRSIWLCAGLVCLAVLTVRPGRRLQIDCLDVGQGDCALVQLPTGENCLIDGGSSSRDKIWEYVIGPAVKYYGIAELDYIFLSHADEDHMNGIAEYIASYEVGVGGRNVHGISVKHIVLPPCASQADFLELRQMAGEKGLKVSRMEAGGKIAGGEGTAHAWQLLCLAPERSMLTGEKNEDSMVLMLSYGQFRMLFTGDLEGEAERRLAASDADLHADVLKVGHHGSAGASGQELLARVQPRIAVISCGRDNAYGHPAQETVDRLAHAGNDIFVTAECGAVSVTTDGKTFAVKSTGNYEKFEKNLKNNGKIPPV